MNLVTMSRDEFDKAVEAQTAVKMALRYLDECTETDETPNVNWIRFLLEGCRLEPWQIEILMEEDCPEYLKKKTSRTAMQDVDEEDMIMR